MVLIFSNSQLPAQRIEPAHDPVEERHDLLGREVVRGLGEADQVGEHDAEHADPIGDAKLVAGLEPLRDRSRHHRGDQRLRPIELILQLDLGVVQSGQCVKDDRRIADDRVDHRVGGQQRAQVRVVRQDESALRRKPQNQQQHDECKRKPAQEQAPVLHAEEEQDRAGHRVIGLQTAAQSEGPDRECVSREHQQDQGGRGGVLAQAMQPWNEQRAAVTAAL